MSAWNPFAAARSANHSTTITGKSATKPFQPLRIVGQDMCCAVGHSAGAASAALMARMNHFRETAFRCDGMPVLGAMLHDLPLLGAARWRLMLERVCVGATQERRTAAQPFPLILLCADPESAGLQAADAAPLLRGLQEAGVADPARSWLLSTGKAGIAEALMQASAMLRESAPATHHVLVAGVDSLLTGAAIDRLHAQGRIRLPGNSDGLIPGEGAAALLLSLVETATPQHAGLVIAGLGQGECSDPWPQNDAEALPLRGRGLVQAVRGAAASAGCAVTDLQFQLSGTTGESRSMREIAIALGQALEQRVQDFDHLPLSAWLGETGSVAPLLGLAWMAHAMPHPLGPGTRGLAHFGNDNGARAALVLHAAHPTLQEA